eukprot:TRINITY_DN89641_c0_g1_i1.p1 TRINITY_DN89641_c0_g1~~TRINITY_DN89641_c0_g1_i1.p1  ORF type:complete len:414 (-),score=56.32 TRINITY_DN89641_c0_g1_i1:203-1315(-)
MLLRRCCRRRACTLMELASGIHGDIPKHLQQRILRVQEEIAVAGEPPTPEEELSRLDASPSKRFQLSDQEWLAHLEQEGYVVLAAVGSPSDVRKAQDLFWDFIEANSSWRRGDHSTWSDVGGRGLGMLQKGLINGAGIGQSDFMWFLRTLPKVRQAFETVWQTKELLVSFDGAGLFRPWQYGFAKTRVGWWHVDQGRAKQGLHAVQGFVSLTPSDSRTGGLSVVPRSHLTFQETTKHQENQAVDYVQLEYHSPALQGVTKRLVTCAAGDLVLWDSRTIHCNSPAKEEPVSRPNELLRSVGYVCMTPTRFANQQVIAERRNMFQQHIGGTHWPHEVHMGSCAAAPNRSLAGAGADIVALVEGSAPVDDAMS